MTPQLITPTDPRTAGLAAAIGTMALKSDLSASYLKVGSASTAWLALATAALEDVIEARVVGASSASEAFTGFAGALDGTYGCEFYVKDLSASGSSIRLRPNGVTTNLNAVELYGGNASPAAGADYTLTVWPIAGAGSAGKEYHGEFIMRAAIGRPRWYASRAYIANPGLAANTFSDNYTGCWNETITAVSTAEIVASAANGIGAGSIFVWYRRRRSTF